MKRTLLILGSSLFFVSCNTLMETPQNSYGGSPTYVAQKNQKGETVYRTKPNSQTYTPPALITPPVVAQNLTPMATTPESSNVGASDSSSLGSSFKGFVELSKDNNQFHLGVHAGDFIDAAHIFFPRIGASLFRSDDEIFLGLDGSVRAYIDLEFLKPFIGLGGYVGDIKKCFDEFNPQTGRNEPVCEKKFLYAGYTEAGLQFWNFQVFARNYNINRAGISVPTDYFIGLGLVFGY